MHPVGSQIFSESARRRLLPWEQAFDEQLERRKQLQIDVRRHLHAHPEPSGEEVETSQYVLGRLREAGIAARVCRSDVGREVGVIADLDLGTSPENAPRIALRCDIDALRMADEKDVPYKSQNPGCAHACGHDAHTSILLGAALAVTGVNAEGNGAAADFGMKLRLLFQPAEETSQGADWLVACGAMDGVDAVLGLHVDPERQAGQVGIRYGALTANCDDVDILITGHGGHAARPHHSIDPVAAAAHLVGALYEFLPRSVDSRSPSVLTFGRIQGGHAPNVIPEEVLLQGTLRTIDSRTRSTLKSRIEQICRGVESTSGAKIALKLHSPLNSVNNDPRIAAALEQAARGVVGPENTQMIDHPSLGGEDFSVYLDHAPGAMLRLGCGIPGTRPPFLHSPVFDVDESILQLGARILMRAAMILAVDDDEP